MHLCFYYTGTNETELQSYFPEYPSKIDASAMLSADLCLRFLPILIENIQNIDPEDTILLMLKKQLNQWHFSAIGYTGQPESMDYTIFEDHCLRQLYVDRIIEKKSKPYAELTFFQKHIKASIGNYGSYFWKELNN